MIASARVMRQGLIPTMLLAACVPPGMRTSFREGIEHARTAIAADAVSMVDVQAGVGKVSVRAGATDSIRVRVSLHSSDAVRLRDTCVPRSEVGAHRTGTALELRLVQHTRNKCGERWLVEVPASTPLRVRLAVGDIEVTGLAGGVVLDVGGPGDIAADVTGGSVVADAANGDISVTSRDTAYARVDVRSDNGRAELSLRGYQVAAPRAPGPASELSSRGSGSSVIRLRTRLGRAKLRIG